MALYLCTDMARYITGAVMHVDAGMTAGKINDIDWENPDPRDLTK
jgi:enoyl-[acyl-carrier-protein] reductase (NADH)